MKLYKELLLPLPWAYITTEKAFSSFRVLLPTLLLSDSSKQKAVTSPATFQLLP